VLSLLGEVVQKVCALHELIIRKFFEETKTISAGF